MSALSNGWYDRFKDRRNALFFFFAPLMIFFLLGSLVRAVWRAVFWRRERIELARLSSDELAKARSKLVKSPKRRIL